MNAREKRDRWKQVERDLTKLAGDALQETKKEFVALSVDQLKRGERSDGTKIGQYKDPHGWYARMKFRQNPLAGEGNIDLIHLGDFSEKLDLDIQGEKFKELSRDDKDELLTQNYGESIFGLQQENMTAFRREEFMPELKKKIANIVNK